MTGYPTMSEHICEICGSQAVVYITTPDGVLHKWCERHMKEKTETDSISHPEPIHPQDLPEGVQQGTTCQCVGFSVF